MRKVFSCFISIILRENAAEEVGGNLPAETTGSGCGAMGCHGKCSPSPSVNRHLLVDARAFQGFPQAGCEAVSSRRF